MDKIHLHIVKWHLYHKLIGIFSHSAVEILPKSFEFIPCLVPCSSLKKSIAVPSQSLLPETIYNSHF